MRNEDGTGNSGGGVKTTECAKAIARHIGQSSVDGSSWASLRSDRSKDCAFRTAFDADDGAASTFAAYADELAAPNRAASAM